MFYLYLEEDTNGTNISTSNNSCSCTNDCKFCALHKIGVFVVNGVSLLLFAVILLVYWRDIYYYCSGQSKRLGKENDSPAQATPPSPPAKDSSPIPESQPIPITANDLPAPPTPVIYQPPSPPPPAPTRPPSTVSPKKAHTLNGKTRTADGLKRHHHRGGHHAKQPAVSPDNKANKTTTADNNEIKLRSVSKRHGTVAPYESTGSNYFKQMMRGKKPVASISQYIVKKHKKEHEKKDDRHKKHTPKHKKL